VIEIAGEVFGLALFGGVFGFLLILGIVSFIAFIWALIDIARAKKDAGYKIIWLVICLVLGIIGVLIYYFVEKRK